MRPACTHRRKSLRVPLPVNGIGTRQRLQVRSNRRPIILCLCTKAPATDEIIDGRCLLQDIPDIGSARAAKLESIVQLIRGVFKITRERVDIILGASISAALLNGGIETIAELI